MVKYLKEDVTWTIEAFGNTAKAEWGYEGEDWIDYLYSLYERVQRGEEIRNINKRKYLKLIKKAIHIVETFHINYQNNMDKFWKMCNTSSVGNYKRPDTKVII